MRETQVCTSAINLRNIMEAIMEEKFELWDKLLILELNDIFSSIQKKKKWLEVPSHIKNYKSKKPSTNLLWLPEGLTFVFMFFSKHYLQICTCMFVWVLKTFNMKNALLNFKCTIYC